MTNSPYHNQQKYINQTLDWCSTDSEQQYNKNVSDNTTREQLQSLGWNFNSIQYKFNSHGFRCREFNSSDAFLTLGCSYTMGEGVKEEQNWPSQVAQRINLPVYNLGVYGSSNMTFFRLADYWIPILKPKFVILQQTVPHRIEFFHSNRDTPETYTVNGLNYHWADNNVKIALNEWWANDINGDLDRKRNTLAIGQICHNYNIPFYTFNHRWFYPQLDLGRDLLHVGPKTHASVAERIVKEFNL